jgi:F-type H+-transporting ATPase subunit b
MSTTRIVSGVAIAFALIALGGGGVYATTDAPSATEPAPGQGSAGDDGHNGHKEVNASPLEFQKDLALWTGVVFLVLLAVLWKFAWGPIARGLDRREKGIADQIAGAEESNRQAQELLEQYQQKLADSKQEVREMLAAARSDAEKAGQEMIDQAKLEALAERQRALEQIDAATAGALKELADLGATMAIDLAGKIVSAELKPTDHAKLIERAVTDFAGSKDRA